jgi:predicted site-specific integrase-resolvase
MMRSEGYLQVREAAQLLGVCPNTIRVWGAAGKVPEYRHPVNNYRLYKRTELERIMSRLEKSVPTSAKTGSTRRGTEEG